MIDAEELLALRAEADLLRNELAQLIAENAALRTAIEKQRNATTHGDASHD